MTIPIQAAQGTLQPTTTILKAANIKTEVGSPTTATIIQQRTGAQTMISTPMLVIECISIAESRLCHGVIILVLSFLLSNK